MANFVLRLLKRRGGRDKSPRTSTSRTGHKAKKTKARDSSDSDAEDDDGIVESKFDYDEGIVSSKNAFPELESSQEALNVYAFEYLCVVNLPNVE